MERRVNGAKPDRQGVKQIYKQRECKNCKEIERQAGRELRETE